MECLIGDVKVNRKRKLRHYPRQVTGYAAQEGGFRTLMGYRGELRYQLKVRH